MTKSGFDLDEIERLLAAAEDSDLTDGGRYFADTCEDLTRCRHGEIGEYVDPRNGEALEALWNARKPMIAAIRELRATVATLGDSARAGANVLDAKDTEIRELRAENARLREALGNIRALSAKRQGEGGANETLTHIEGFARQALAVRAELERIADE